MRSFRFISDPGHGWLEVPWADLKMIGLKATDFSKYSYRDGRGVYLEEDCDAPKFLDAYRALTGTAPGVVEVYQDKTFIRHLPSIRVPT